MKNRSIPRDLHMWFCVAYVIIPALTLTLTSAQEVATSAAGQWGPWTSWSVCSQTCGSGLAYRIRYCHRSSDGGTNCEGDNKQFKVCNRQDCPGGKEDYRTTECRKHNRNYYGGRRYEWEAFINPYARCELACKARHHRYYARFGRTVQDGTRCKHDTDALCLAGKCLDVGCDDILGSGAVVDQCGICGGDGSTCRVISGIFTRTRLRQYGYHQVTTIPTGACNVNITELARSRNFLALTTAAGDNIVNANRELRAVGQYSGAGTTFDYRRRSGMWCPGACIFADGPLAEPVEVQLLYYDRNPGIMYHFTVPQDTADAVMNAANTTHHNHHHNHHHSHPAQKHSAHSQHSNTSTARDDTDREPSSPPSSPSQAAEARGGSSGQRQPKVSRPTRRGKHKKTNRQRQRQRQRLSSLQASTADPRASSSLKDAPVVPRERPSTSARRQGGNPSAPQSGARREPLRSSPRRRPAAAASPGESPYQPGPSPAVPRQASVANAPLYVPPEEEGAPIEYKHYYHLGSDDYRRHWQRAGLAGLDGGHALSRQDVAGAGAGGEALSRPNIIPATRDAARRSWGSSGGEVVGNHLNAVGDVPLAVPASGYFVWTISGFSACSEPCGGGVQQTVVVCMKSDTRVVVMAENCDLNARPSPTTVECNSQPCEPQWTAEEWSECSVTCGHGVQSRTVECKQRISPTLHLSVSADRCSEQKPPVTQFCRRQACFQWRLSNWTKCSTNCGLGERTRTISCINGEGEEVAASRCNLERPKTREICDMGSCAEGWYYTRWTKDCSSKCGGKSYKTRKVYCAAEDGATLPVDRCPADQKPRARKACGAARPCGGQWFSGPWSECNSTCGHAWRTRDVVCMKKHGRQLWSVVGKENCLRRERPRAKEICTELPPCQPDWYMTHWSECSKSCGTGIKTREVKCLDPSLQPSLACNNKRRPHERRPCNKHACRDNATASRRRGNDYDVRPQIAPAPQRYAESTSPNTTYQSYQRNRNRQPLALQASAPTHISLQKDVRSAMGDSAEGNSHHQRRRVHHHHHTRHEDQQQPPQHSHTDKTEDSDQDSTSEDDVEQTTKARVVDPSCTDKPSSRWCMFVSQARLCGYHIYKKRCCHTCSVYQPHH